MNEILRVGIFALLLTLFLDLVDLSFGQVLWFMRTLRFWLYFTFHFMISCGAAYLLHFSVTEWYVLAPVATLLGVGVISNANIKIGGFSIVPFADAFLSLKAKMFEQAGREKEAELAKAQLVDRLRSQPSSQLERMCTTALTAASWNPERIQTTLDDAKASSKGKDEYYKLALIHLLLKTNYSYAEEEIRKALAREPTDKTSDLTKR